MDTFEKMMQAMKAMTPAELDAAVTKARGMCICGDCPTYNSCAKKANELLFCATGKSFMCISAEKECICPKCPVTPAFGLKHTFYCTRGAEKAQRYEQAIWGTKMV